MGDPFLRGLFTGIKNVVFCLNFQLAGTFVSFTKKFKKSNSQKGKLYKNHILFCKIQAQTLRKFSWNFAASHHVLFELHPCTVNSLLHASAAHYLS